MKKRFQNVGLATLLGCVAAVVGVSEASMAEDVLSSTVCANIEGKTCGSNIIQNGDFSAGNQYFSSDYTYITSACCCKSYTIHSNANTFYNHWVNVDGHGGSGDNFFLGDAPCSLIPSMPMAWKQNINVVQGIKYAIELWVVNLDDPVKYVNRATIAVADGNGVIIATNSFTIPANNEWTKVCAILTAPLSGTITLGIIAGPSDPTQGILGADFGLDDISVKPLEASVNPVFKYNQTSPLLCEAKFTPTITGGVHFWNFGDALNTTSNDVSPTFNYGTSGTYNVTHTLIVPPSGCNKSITLPVTVNCILPEIIGGEEGIGLSFKDASIYSFPNPFSERMQIELIAKDDLSPVSLELFDIQGRRVMDVFTGEVEQGRHSFSWRPSPYDKPGIYYVKVFIEGETKTLLVNLQ